ncbi:ABC transporter substrate-binding protein [Sphingomonas carotinifaciens]|uniref:ABC transporter substrate-binding protein n=1 Tax=Sphingomonas carotinifaciens TaxID=1166323 RepID=UPI00399FB7E1
MSSGCERRRDSGPVIVSAIGQPPAAGHRDWPQRLLVDATAQGLVRFDAAGQIEPGLAERWIVTDNGGSYIFRLREANWADGRPVTAEQVVDILQGRLRAAADHALLPFLTAIDEVVVMTPQVIEVRLARPRPDLLKLFAQPELAIIRSRAGGGTGPMRVSALRSAAPLLRPIPDPTRAEPEDSPTPTPEEEVRLIGERASLALVRFGRRESDLVSGGTIADWPLVALSGAPPATVRLDPAAGLFGLAVVRREGFLADAANRQALSQAFDRATLVASLARGWEPMDRLLPEALDSGAPPQVPGWSLQTLDQRRADARTRVAGWGSPVRLAIALPDAPGTRLLYAQIAATLQAIGIGSVRVKPTEPADLRLVDAVAPYDSARWYLATACRPCSEAAQAALEQARLAPTLGDRAQALAAADIAMNQDTAFIPLARPLRWSLVASRLRQWQPNARAWHPLNRLRADTN